MDEIQTPLKVAQSLWDQLQHAPSHLLWLLFLLAIGIIIRRSPVPNTLIPLVLFTVGAVGYPFIASPGNVDPSFRHPMIVLGIYGGLLALASVAAHMFVLSRFAWFRKFERYLALAEPENPPPGGPPSV